MRNLTATLLLTTVMIGQAYGLERKVISTHSSRQFPKGATFVKLSPEELYLAEPKAKVPGVVPGPSYLDPDENIWTSEFKAPNGEPVNYLTQDEAREWCEERGAELPSKEDYKRLAHFMGKGKSLEQKVNWKVQEPCSTNCQWTDDDETYFQYKKNTEEEIFYTDKDAKNKMKVASFRCIYKNKKLDKLKGKQLKKSLIAINYYFKMLANNRLSKADLAAINDDSWGFDMIYRQEFGVGDTAVNSELMRKILAANRDGQLKVKVYKSNDGKKSYPKFTVQK